MPHPRIAQLALVAGLVLPSLASAQDCDPTTEDCTFTSHYGEDPLPAPTWGVAWTDLDHGEVLRLAAGSGETLGLGLYNGGDSLVLANVEVRLRDDDGWNTSTVASREMIRAGDLVTVDIEPEAIANSLSGLDYAAEIQVYVTFTDRSGDVLRRSGAPNLYLHDSRRSL